MSWRPEVARVPPAITQVLLNDGAEAESYQNLTQARVIKRDCLAPLTRLFPGAATTLTRVSPLVHPVTRQ